MALAAPKAKLLDFWNSFEAASTIPIDHTPLDEVLAKYVVVDHPSGLNRVRYTDITDDDKRKLRRYTGYLQNFDPRQLNRDAALAYWLNLYNVGVLLVVLENPDANTITEVEGKGIWRLKRFEVTFQKLSFDDIQHGIIRPIWQDARTHFALSCGCVGSGQVMPQAFTPENLDQLLSQTTRSFLASQNGMVISEDEIELSRLFRWYRADFGDSNSGIASFVAQYLDEQTESQFQSINTNRFDWFHSWRLNKP